MDVLRTSDDLGNNRKVIVFDGEEYERRTVDVKPEYTQLFDELVEAYKQAADGKGKERHAGNGKPFDRQPIFEIPRMIASYGLGFLLGQAMKKTHESSNLFLYRGKEAALRELDGAICYLAAAKSFMKEKDVKCSETLEWCEASDDMK